MHNQLDRTRMAAKYRYLMKLNSSSVWSEQLHTYKWYNDIEHSVERRFLDSKERRLQCAPRTPVAEPRPPLSTLTKFA